MALLLTNYSVTTSTIEALYHGVEFHEEELIKLVVPNERVIDIGCNFGRVIFAGYVAPDVKAKSNRGRRKKDKPRKRRKRQGSGLYMNSQITFTVLSPKVYGKKYKVKVFRNGKIQIPGIIHESLDEAFYAINEARLIIINALGIDESECYLKPYDDGELTTLIIKNFKWNISDKKWIIDREKFVSHLKKIRSKEIIDNDVTILSISYDLSRYPGVVFKVKSHTNGNDHYCFRVFKGGKTNLTISKNKNNDIVDSLKNWIGRLFKDGINNFIYDQTVDDDDGDSN